MSSGTKTLSIKLGRCMSTLLLKLRLGPGSSIVTCLVSLLKFAVRDVRYGLQKRSRWRSGRWFPTGEFFETCTGHASASSSHEYTFSVRVFQLFYDWNVCTWTENGVHLLHDCIPQKCNERAWPRQFKILSSFSSTGKGLASRHKWTGSILYLPCSFRLVSFSNCTWERWTNIDMTKYTHL